MGVVDWGRGFPEVGKFVAPGGYLFNRGYLAIDDHQRFVEVIHCGADVTRNEIEILAYRRQRRTDGRFDREMLLAGFERR